MKRLAEFVRSVLPADPTQLLLLAGMVCVTVAPHLRWLPEEPVLSDRARLGTSIAMWPLIFSGLAGYWVCLRPSRRPVMQLLWLVFAPALLATALVAMQVLGLDRGFVSVLETTRRITIQAALVHWATSKATTGVHFCLAGLFFIAIYASRLAFGIAELPLSLPASPCAGLRDEGNGEWRNLTFLIWILIGPLFILFNAFAFITILLPPMLTSKLPFSVQSTWFSRLPPTLGMCLVFGILLWIMGKENRHAIWSSMKLPEPRYAALGFAIPVGIECILSLGQYLVDRAFWATHYFGKFAPPQSATYFSLPDPWLLVLFFGALFEEMVFRGLLQRRFVQRYGVYRGIFLVGIVWAAFHFASDFSYRHLTELDVLLTIAWRIFFCLAGSYVLGWLTLRFDSILPAAFAHTFYNVLVFTKFGPPFFGKVTVRAGLWAVLGMVLFRYWPIQLEGKKDEVVNSADPEPAI